MAQLHEQLAAAVDDWRSQGYPCDAYPTIAEILEWSHDNDSGGHRFLRHPQLRAAETYWYLRLIPNTPHVFDLYQHFYPRPRELREALGLTQDAIRDLVEDHGIEALWQRIKTDDEFVRDFRLESLRETKAEVANLRLQAIASLPHLAVFSDEAHHTYGQSLDTGLKKVRKTVDYLAAQTNVIAVVNTTGTPYFKRQPLRDVVFWYGLSQGINDGYLKDLAGNIQALAVRKWENLNPDRLRYEMIFTDSGTIAGDQLQNVRRFVEESET